MTVSINVDKLSQISHVHEVVVDTAKSITSKEQFLMTIKITSLVRHIGMTSKKMLDNARSLPVVGALKLAKFGLVPFGIYEIGMLIYSAQKVSISEKIDALLGVTAAVGSLGEITANIAEGLTAVGLVAAKAIAWATPLGLICAGIQVANMVLTAKSLAETHRFSKIFNQVARWDRPVEECLLEDYKKMRQLIEKEQTQEKSFIDKHFKTNGDHLIERLQAIESKAQLMLASANPLDISQAKNDLKRTMQALSKRMTTKKWSNALSLLIGAVSFIGVGLLFSPCPPAGFAVLALTSGMSIIQFFVEKMNTTQFEKELGIKRGK